MTLTTGKLIAFEGIDGAGKGTQMELLIDFLNKVGIKCIEFSFPQYESAFGQVVGKYLRGEFGDLYQISPYLSALPYALDRFQARGAIIDHLEKGFVIIMDRYVGSNVAHQSARLPINQRDEFARWLSTVEYDYLGMPREDLTLYLRIPSQIGYKMVEKKAQRSYMSASRDIHETDSTYQNEVAQVFDHLAESNDCWMTISTTNAAGQLMGKDTIHLAVVEAIKNQLGISV
jgi:dTMP kinase